MQKQAPWKRPTPKKVQKRGTKHLTTAQKAHAKARAKRAGRPYPNMVDNMAEAAASKTKPTKKKAAKKTTAKKAGAPRKAAKKATRKAAPRKAAARKSTPRKKAAKKKAAPRKKAAKKSSRAAPTKDPHGGLTSAGRRAFHERDGSNLKPGVKKKVSEMSRSEMKRKGSWAVRFYGREKLPALIDEHGKPTRFALSAAAWGEPVPRTPAAARKIAARGHRLLERAARA